MKKAARSFFTFSLLFIMSCTSPVPEDSNNPSSEGGSCTQNKDCKEGLFCKKNICSKPCQKHSDCNMLEQHCEDGFCLPGKSTSCGNGVREADEACDDGDNNNKNGCDATCHIEAGFSC